MEIQRIMIFSCMVCWPVEICEFRIAGLRRLLVNAIHEPVVLNAMRRCSKIHPLGSHFLCQIAVDVPARPHLDHGPI